MRPDEDSEEPALDPEPKALHLRDEGERRVGLPLAAMADALRAQAEALERVQSTQRQIAETLDRNDKATNVIASTRALNETFKGLSDIQRGLLQAVTGGGARGRGAVAAFAAIVLLSLGLGALAWERLRSGDTVAAATYRDAVARGDEWRAELERTRIAATGADARLLAAESARDAAAREVEALGRRIGELEAEAKELKALSDQRAVGLEDHLRLESEADRAARLDLEVVDLQRRLRAAEERFEGCERERGALAALVLQQKVDAKSPADRLLAEAKEQGLIPETPPAPAPGIALLPPQERRHLRTRLNRLLQNAGASESYDVIDLAGVRDGVVLLDVRLGCYDGVRLLNSMEAKELEVLVDAEADTVELRLSGGAITSVRKPGEKVPFADGKHSVFVQRAGVKDWLGQVSRSVSVGVDGRLTWKTGPS